MNQIQTEFIYIYIYIYIYIVGVVYEQLDSFVTLEQRQKHVTHDLSPSLVFQFFRKLMDRFGWLNDFSSFFFFFFFW
jgi:hypothetical protein